MIDCLPSHKRHPGINNEEQEEVVETHIENTQGRRVRRESRRRCTG